MPNEIRDARWLVRAKYEMSALGMTAFLLKRCGCYRQEIISISVAHEELPIDACGLFGAAALGIRLAMKGRRDLDIEVRDYASHFSVIARHARWRL